MAVRILHNRETASLARELGVAHSFVSTKLARGMTPDEIRSYVAARKVLIASGATVMGRLPGQVLDEHRRVVKLPRGDKSGGDKGGGKSGDKGDMRGDSSGDSGILIDSPASSYTKYRPRRPPPAKIAENTSESAKNRLKRLKIDEKVRQVAEKVRQVAGSPIGVGESVKSSDRGNNGKNNGHSTDSGDFRDNLGHSERPSLNYGENIAQAQLRKEIATATEREIRVAEAQKYLAPIPQFNRWYGGQIIRLREDLMKLAPEMRDRLAATVDPIKVEEMLDREFRRILEGLALMDEPQPLPEAKQDGKTGDQAGDQIGYRAGDAGGKDE